jgi:hypothetical protein
MTVFQAYIYFYLGTVVRNLRVGVLCRRIYLRSIPSTYFPFRFVSFQPLNIGVHDGAPYSS